MIGKLNTAITLILFSGVTIHATAAPPATKQSEPKVERVYSPIKLPKHGFIHLDVLDSFKERRAFLVTCEKTLDSKITDALRQTGVGYHPLKKGEKQSLINHWQTPATDYVIVCEGN